ncbi:transposase [Wolbachia endosymbiont of Phyllotreta cruciferae]|uniref:transposase n=1 Tax=Wolbachia endosymbiont of Phyllotreta cruciferae TaxID=2886377 RepID=UPI00351139C3
MSSRESANKELLAAIQKIYQVSKCRYGAPKIHAELKALGKSCNLKTVQSIMQKNDIRAILLLLPTNINVCCIALNGITFA